MTRDRILPPDDDDLHDAAAAAEFGAMLEDFERTRPNPRAASPNTAGRRDPGSELRVGSRVQARVVSVSGDSLLLDVGGRSEAVADAREFRRDDGTLTVELGQVLDLAIVEMGESPVLSRIARPSGRGRVSLDAIRQAREAGLAVRGRVTALNTGGLAVDVDGVRAFCPLSQVDAGFVEDASTFVGRTLEFLVTEVDEARRNVVVSRRKWLQREQAAAAEARLATLAPGQDLEGTVTRLEPFGAFVDLGGLDGLVHVSEVSHARVAHPREVVAVGDRVQVRVLKVEPGRDGRARVALSLKAAAPDPWHDAVRAFPPGARVSGVVVRLADFGAFVNLAPGVDGLVHVSHLSSRRITHPREVVSPGQAVEAVVLAVEPERRRVSLSMREAAADAPPPSRMRRTEETDDEPVAPRPTVVEEGPSPMQLAFRRAREEAERRARGES